MDPRDFHLESLRGLTWRMIIPGIGSVVIGSAPYLQAMKWKAIYNGNNPILMGLTNHGY